MTVKKLKEEIGRNYHTLDTSPYTWKDYSNVDVETYVAEDGSWHAKVICLSDDNLSTSLHSFPDEGSASFWAQQQSDRIMRKTINERSDISSTHPQLRAVIREIILEIFEI